jgi:hypothetical protein
MDCDCEFALATPVTIQGTSREDLNGSSGIVEAFDRAQQRYAVRTTAGKRMSLRPEHLVRALKLTPELLGYDFLGTSKGLNFVYPRAGDMDCILRLPVGCIQIRATMSRKGTAVNTGGGNLQRFKVSKEDSGCRPGAYHQAGGEIVRSSGGFCVPIALGRADGEVEVTCCTGAFPPGGQDAPGNLMDGRYKDAVRYAITQRVVLKAPKDDGSGKAPKVWVQVGSQKSDGVVFQLCFRQFDDAEVASWTEHLQGRDVAVYETNGGPTDQPRQTAKDCRALRDLWMIVDMAVTSPNDAPPFWMQVGNVVYETNDVARSTLAGVADPRQFTTRAGAPGVGVADPHPLQSAAENQPGSVVHPPSTSASGLSPDEV